jgi:hypothetical protein
MAVNLFALCRPLGAANVKHVSLSRQLQEQLEGVFLEYEREFRDGIEAEVDFTGGWNADPEEILRAPLPDEARAVVDQLRDGALGRDDLNTADVANEGVRGLLVPIKRGQHTLILVQNFSAQQLLSRKWALIAQGNEFRRIDESAFSIGSKIDGVIEGGFLKFSSYHTIRQVFKLSDLYREASDQEITAFAQHEKIAVDDAQQLCGFVNQAHRKLITAISSGNKLDGLEVDYIRQRAVEHGINLQTHAGKITIPVDRTLKDVLMFLDDAIYSAPLRGELYMTNSKRRFAPRP